VFWTTRDNITENYFFSRVSVRVNILCDADAAFVATA